MLGFNLNIYPFGNFFVSFYAVVMAYSIVKHRFLDIRLVILRTITYSVVVLIVSTAVVGTTLLLPSQLAISISSKTVIAITVSIFIVLILDPLKKGIANAMDKIFSKPALIIRSF